MNSENKLDVAKQGDINAFNELFQKHNEQLKSYLYRLLTNREDVEDFCHNTFIKAFDKLGTFQGNATQLKSWIFTIATNLSMNHLTIKKRWKVNAQDECRDSLVTDVVEQKNFIGKVIGSTHNTYEVKEHIDFCFTCINKTLSIEKQTVLLLKTVYDFKVQEVADVVGKTLGQVKHLLIDARKEMTDIFAGRCALINQNGTCYQCSELQGLFNPKLNFQREVNNLKMAKDIESNNKFELFALREELISQVNPLNNNGADLHDQLMQHLKKVNELD